jgi:hypothetical protein
MKQNTYQKLYSTVEIIANNVQIIPIAKCSLSI